MTKYQIIAKEINFYSTQSPFSDPGKYIYLYKSLPTDLRRLCRIVHGLIIHPGDSRRLYEFNVPKDRQSEANLHYLEDIIGKIVSLDSSPLVTTRIPEKRVVGLCRDFALLLTSILRYQGVPARTRCGFATYFHNDRRPDHWVTEYWDQREARWILVDSEIGIEEKSIDRVRINHIDVDRDQFLVAGMAWNKCRAGLDKSDNFGASIPGINGWWFMRASLWRDLACLNKIELQPWDYNSYTNNKFTDLEELDSRELRRLDRLADVISKNDRLDFEEIIKTYKDNPLLQVRKTVVSFPGSRPVEVVLK